MDKYHNYSWNVARLMVDYGISKEKAEHLLEEFQEARIEELSQYKQQLVEKIRLKGNRITKSPLYNQALKDVIEIVKGGL